MKKQTAPHSDYSEQAEATLHAEMLTALKSADQRIKELCDTVNVLAKFRKVRAEDYADKVRVAIAKAEGR